MNYIDSFLNRITMYRLVWYYLSVLIAVAVVCGAFGLIGYSPLAILFSTALATGVCWIVNELCAYLFKAHPNVESVYISAFIITLIVTPVVPSNIAGIAF